MAAQGWGEVKAVTSAEATPSDDIERLLNRALGQYRAGNFKAAVANAADAINDLARREDINGGGWY